MLDFEEALQFFATTDPVLADLMQRVMYDPAMNLRNPVRATPDQYVFRLYRSIISQQISTKAADKILERLIAGPEGKVLDIGDRNQAQKAHDKLFGARPAADLSPREIPRYLRRVRAFRPQRTRPGSSF